MDAFAFTTLGVIFTVLILCYISRGDDSDNDGHGGYG